MVSDAFLKVNENTAIVGLQDIMVLVITMTHPRIWIRILSIGIIPQIFRKSKQTLAELFTPESAFILQTANPRKKASAIPLYPPAFPICQPVCGALSWQA